MARLPVPKPPDDSREFHSLVSLSRKLAEAGIDAAPDAYAQLNAIVAKLYGITGADYAHVVASFPLLSRELRDRCIEAERESR
jgi:hypothetical protein